MEAEGERLFSASGCINPFVHIYSQKRKTACFFLAPTPAKQFRPRKRLYTATSASLGIAQLERGANLRAAVNVSAQNPTHPGLTKVELIDFFICWLP